MARGESTLASREALGAEGGGALLKVQTRTFRSLSLSLYTRCSKSTFWPLVRAFVPQLARAFGPFVSTHTVYNALGLLLRKFNCVAPASMSIAVSWQLFNARFRCVHIESQNSKAWKFLYFFKLFSILKFCGAKETNFFFPPTQKQNKLQKKKNSGFTQRVEDVSYARANERGATTTIKESKRERGSFHFGDRNKKKTDSARTPPIEPPPPVCCTRICRNFFQPSNCTPPPSAKHIFVIYL